MTRKEMEAVIKGGGSVLLEGRVVTKLDDLPTAADLAKGDPEAEAKVAEGLQAQIDDLKGQLQTIRPGQVEPDNDLVAAQRAIEEGKRRVHDALTDASEAKAQAARAEAERTAALDLHSGLLKDYEGLKGEVAAAEAETERVAGERDKAFADWQADIEKNEAKITDLEKRLANATKAAQATAAATEKEGK